MWPGILVPTGAPGTRSARRAPDTEEAGAYGVQDKEEVGTRSPAAAFFLSNILELGPLVSWKLSNLEFRSPDRNPHPTPTPTGLSRKPPKLSMGMGQGWGRSISIAPFVSPTKHRVLGKEGSSVLA